MVYAVILNGSYNGSVPKGLVEVCERPILHHQLESLNRCRGIEGVIVTGFSDVEDSVNFFVRRNKVPKPLYISRPSGDSFADSVRASIYGIDAFNVGPDDKVLYILGDVPCIPPDKLGLFLGEVKRPNELVIPIVHSDKIEALIRKIEEEFGHQEIQKNHRTYWPSRDGYWHHLNMALVPVSKLRENNEHVLEGVNQYYENRPITKGLNFPRKTSLLLARMGFLGLKIFVVRYTSCLVFQYWLKGTVDPLKNAVTIEDYETILLRFFGVKSHLIQTDMPECFFDYDHQKDKMLLENLLKISE